MPRSARQRRTVDLPAPEIPVTHTNGTEEFWPLVATAPQRRLRGADLCGYLRDGQVAHHGSYVRGVTVVNRPIACVREH
jgi:hypothetical protein